MNQVQTVTLQRQYDLAEHSIDILVDIDYTREQNKKKEMLSGIFQLIPLY